MSRPAGLTALAVLFALATWFAGWWTVPVLAALWGVRRRPLDALAAAALAWVALLAVQALRGPMVPLADRVGGVLGVSAWAALLAVPMYAGLLAWSAAATSRALTTPRRPVR